MREDNYSRPRSECRSRSRNRWECPDAMHMHDEITFGSTSGLASVPNEPAYLPRGGRLAEEIPRMPERRHPDAFAPRRLFDHGCERAAVLPRDFNAVTQVCEGHRELPDGDGQPAVVFQRTRDHQDAEQTGHYDRIASMKIAFFWTGVTGPMVSCWKALACQPAVRVKVFVELARRDDSAFDHLEMLDGLDSEVLFSEDQLDRNALGHAVRAFDPDVIIAIGWRSPMVRSVVESSAFAGVPKIFAFDMPFAWSLRKLVAPIILRRYLRRFVAALVPGERSARYARHLGFRPDQIETGLISLDTVPFLAADRRRRGEHAFPRRFLYVGRYAREKRIDVLIHAYSRYRSTTQAPWELSCCGMGPLAPLLAGQPGVTDLGFVQPRDLPPVYAAHGAFVITSDYEPWGMVIAEAAAAGLPIICTDACGARLEVVRHGENGIVCAKGDTAAIASAMKWVTDHEESLPAMGSRSLELVSPYSSHEWVHRVLRRCHEAVKLTSIV